MRPQPPALATCCTPLARRRASTSTGPSATPRSGARHLSALEDGDYSELPGAVYTKGFLRNYALYLGLDPDRGARSLARGAGSCPARFLGRRGAAAAAAGRPAPRPDVHAQPHRRRGARIGRGAVPGLCRDAAVPVLAGARAAARWCLAHPGRRGPDELRADRHRPCPRHDQGRRPGGDHGPVGGWHRRGALEPDAARCRRAATSSP